MSEGDFRTFREQFASVNSGALAEGMYLSVVCAEDAPYIRADQRASAVAGTFLGAYRLEEQTRACEEWNIPAVALTYAQRPQDVPLLIVAGDRDYVTPVAWSRRVMSAFPRSRLVVVPKLGHFPDGLENPQCLDAITNAFFERGDPASLDVSCVSSMKPGPFVGSVKGKTPADAQ